MPLSIRDTSNCTHGCNPYIGAQRAHTFRKSKDASLKAKMTAAVPASSCWHPGEHLQCSMAWSHYTCVPQMTGLSQGNTLLNSARVRSSRFHFVDIISWPCCSSLICCSTLSKWASLELPEFCVLRTSCTLGSNPFFPYTAQSPAFYILHCMTAVQEAFKDTRSQERSRAALLFPRGVPRIAIGRGFKESAVPK